MPLPIANHINELFTDIRSPKLLPGLIQGFIIGAILVIVEISFASVIFSGPLSSFATRAAGMCIFGAAAMSLVSGLFSPFTTLVSLPQDTPVAILSLAAGSIAASLAAASPETRFATVTAMVMGSAMATALFFWCIGRFRLSNIARFLPYPVIGGFLAGSGAALMIGSFGVMTGTSLSWSTLPQYVTPDLFMHWGPGVAFAVVAFCLMQRTPHFLILPGSLLVGFAAFFLLVGISDLTILDLRAKGWLLATMPSGQIWPGFTLETAGSIHWPTFIGQIPDILTVALLALVGLILNMNGIELGARQDIDLDKELRVESAGNLIASLGGGFAGYGTLSLSMLGPRSNTVTRIIPITASLVCMGVLFFGASGLSFLPKPLLGGLLFLLGSFFVVEWLLSGWKRLTPTDYLIVVAIVVTIVAKGFLIGVSLGLGLTIIIFMFRFTRIPVIRGEHTLASIRSSTQRSVPDQSILSLHGRDCRVFKLTGYLFFGSTYFLGKQVKELLEGDILTRRIVIDLERIHGFDISAVSTFQRMGQQCLAKNTYITLAAPPERLVRLLEKNASSEVMQRFVFCEDVDLALEKAENEILRIYHQYLDDTREGGKAREELFRAAADELDDHLERQERLEEILERMETSIERRMLTADEVLVHEGTPSSHVFFVLWGSVSLFVDDEQGNPRRIGVLGPGRIITPHVTWKSRPAAYTARVEQQAMVAAISRENLTALEHRDQETAMFFYKFMARTLTRSQ
ncbi:SulP family inorganic anion transporter [Desulfoplanes sp.]